MSRRVEVSVRHDAAGHRFDARVGDQVAGHVSYRRDGDGPFDLHHTEVEESYEGQGVGSALASGTLEQVRSMGAKVIPSCPFIKRYIDEHEVYADLVAR